MMSRIEHAHRVPTSADDQGDPRYRRAGAGGGPLEHHPVGAEPPDQGHRGAGRGGAVRAPVQAAETVGGGAQAARCGRADPAAGRRARGRVRGAEDRQVGAAAYRDRVPCLFRMAVPGARAVPQGVVRGRHRHPPRPRLRCAAGAAPRGGGPGRVLGSRGPARRRFHAFVRLRAGVRRRERPSAGGPALDRGGRFPRRDADHLSGRPLAARRVLGASDAGQGRAGGGAPGRADGGDPAIGGVAAGRCGAARLGRCRR